MSERSEPDDEASNTLALPAPVGSSQRSYSIDALRGFALLGILMINILWIALPGVSSLNPLIAGGFAGANFIAWTVGYLLFEEKMITIFSMLFGAGLVLMADRMQQHGRSPAAFFYRRAVILLVIGLAHAYLLWAGDILVSYALCGMLIYPLRRLSPRNLVIVGLLVLLPAMLLARREGTHLAGAREAALRVRWSEEHGKVPNNADLDRRREWEETQAVFRPTSEKVAKDIDVFRRAPYRKLFQIRASAAFEIETRLFVTNFLWTISGRMLIGMSLMKWGVFSGQWSLLFYVRLAIIGYSLGLPIVAFGAYSLVKNDFDVVDVLGGGMAYNEFGSLLVALGHVGAVIAIIKARRAAWLTGRLAAAGRMALSNYLMQSLICTTLFYSYGFGLFGTLDRVQLLGVVGTIWAVQLWYSPIWLRHFRFGPMEWLWRSLTYGKAQPMRISASLQKG